MGEGGRETEKGESSWGLGVEVLKLGWGDAIGQKAKFLLFFLIFIYLAVTDLRCSMGYLTLWHVGSSSRGPGFKAPAPES